MNGSIFGYDTGQINNIFLMNDFKLRFATCSNSLDRNTCEFSTVRSGLIVSFLSIGTLAGALTGTPCVIYSTELTCRNRRTMWYARQKIRDGVRVWNVCHRRHRTALSPFLPGSMLPLVVWSLILVHQALPFQWRIVRFFDLPGTTPRRQLLEKGRDNTTTAARHPYCRTLVIYYIKNSCCMWVRITCFIFQWWFQFPGDSQVPRVRYFQPN